MPTRAKRLVARLARDFPREHEPCPIGSDRALDTALITAPEARDPELIKKLDAVAGRVLEATCMPALAASQVGMCHHGDADKPAMTRSVMTSPPSKTISSAAIRTIPDYPKPGIMFRDITTLLGDARAFRRAVDELVQPWAGMKIDKVAGIEARGFILGGAVAHQVSAGFIPIRKKGKLPHKTREHRLFAGIRPRRDGDARGRRSPRASA